MCVSVRGAHYSEGRYLIIIAKEDGKEIELAEVLFRQHDVYADHEPWARNHCGGAGKDYVKLSDIGLAFARSSSQLDEAHAPAKVIDGNFGTSAVTARGDGSDNKGAWVQVDLTKDLTGVDETRVDAIAIRFDEEISGELCLNNLLYGTNAVGSGQGENACVSTYGGEGIFL